MKLKKFRHFFEKADLIDSDEYYIGDIKNGDMEHLLYLVKSLFKNSNIEASVYNEDLDIFIDVVLNKREKIKKILSVFDVAKKLKEDIFPQYESEFELWKTKDGEPLLTFNFIYTGGPVL